MVRDRPSPAFGTLSPLARGEGSRNQDDSQFEILRPACGEKVAEGRMRGPVISSVSEGSGGRVARGWCHPTPRSLAHARDDINSVPSPYSPEQTAPPPSDRCSS